MARVFSDGVEGQPGAAPESTLASGIAIGATSSTVQAGHGARFPATGDFSIRFEDATDSTHFEVVTATARTTDTITHGATTFAWDSGDKVIHVISAGDFAAIEASLASKQALADAGGEELGYAAVTANQTGIGTSLTDLTNLSVTVDCDGTRPVVIVCKATMRQRTAAALFTEVYIREGSTDLMHTDIGVYAADGWATHYFSWRGIPAAGSHTYKLSALTANNTMDMQVTATNPSFIQVIQLAV